MNIASLTKKDVTVLDIYNTLTETQKEAVAIIVDLALKESQNEKNEK